MPYFTKNKSKKNENNTIFMKQKMYAKMCYSTSSPNKNFKKFQKINQLKQLNL